MTAAIRINFTDPHLVRHEGAKGGTLRQPIVQPPVTDYAIRGNGKSKVFVRIHGQS